jgi:hypothetical protein
VEQNMAELLIVGAIGAAYAMSKKSVDQRTELHLLARKGGRPIEAKNLILAGADPNQRDSKGKSAYSLARQYGHYDTLKAMQDGEREVAAFKRRKAEAEKQEAAERARAEEEEQEINAMKKRAMETALTRQYERELYYGNSSAGSVNVFVNTGNEPLAPIRTGAAAPSKCRTCGYNVNHNGAATPKFCNNCGSKMPGPPVVSGRPVPSRPVPSRPKPQSFVNSPYGEY